MDRPVVITGAHGFIGTHLRAAIPHAKTLWLATNVLEQIALLRPSRIYHLAARGVLSKDRRMGAMLENNVTRHGELLDAVRQCAPDCHVICAGSVFDDDVNDYGHTKRLAREMAEYYRRHHGLRISVLRFHNVYGPGEHPSRLIPYAIQCCLNGETIRIGGGDQRRTWLYVDDAVRALMRAEPSKTEEAVGQSETVSGVVGRIIRLIGKPVNLDTTAPLRDDALRDYDGRSMTPIITLDDGLRAHARSLGWER